MAREEYIRIYRSDVVGATPSLTSGEIAANLVDGNFFIGGTNGSLLTFIDNSRFQLFSAGLSAASSIYVGRGATSVEIGYRPLGSDISEPPVNSTLIKANDAGGLYLLSSGGTTASSITLSQYGLGLGHNGLSGFATVNIGLAQRDVPEVSPSAYGSQIRLFAWDGFSNNAVFAVRTPSTYGSGVVNLTLPNTSGELALTRSVISSINGITGAAGLTVSGNITLTMTGADNKIFRLYVKPTATVKGQAGALAFADPAAYFEGDGVDLGASNSLKFNYQTDASLETPGTFKLGTLYSDSFLQFADGTTQGTAAKVNVVTSIGGCTGDFTITGTTNEVVVTTGINCRSIVIGLPDNVSIPYLSGTGATFTQTVRANRFIGSMDGGYF